MSRFAAVAARFCPQGCKPLPPKPQAFRTIGANQKHNGAVPTLQRCCSRFTVVFSPLYASCRVNLFVRPHKKHPCRLAMSQKFRTSLFNTQHGAAERLLLLFFFNHFPQAHSAKLLAITYNLTSVHIMLHIHIQYAYFLFINIKNAKNPLFFLYLLYLCNVLCSILAHPRAEL